MGFVFQRHENARLSIHLFRVSAVIALVHATGSSTFPVEAKSGNAAKVALSEMTGKWKGTGWGKRNSSAPKEGVRCRLTARFRSKNRKLSVSGKCAATSRTFTLLGHVAEYNGSNKMTGRWVNPSGIGSMKIAGTRKGNNLIFTFIAKEDKTGKRRKYRSIWSLKRNGFDLRSQIAGKTFRDIGNIQFRR